MKLEERRFQAFLEDRIDAIEKILRYIQTLKDANDFLTNEMIIDAVTRNYEIIGEASNKIPQVIKEQYPEVPWRQMYGLRNFAVHEYHIIDPIILWEIAQDHLPTNLEQLRQILEKEKNTMDNVKQPDKWDSIYHRRASAQTQTKGRSSWKILQQLSNSKLR